MTEIDELLRSEDYWQDVDAEFDVATGDLFESLPLLSNQAGPVTGEDEWGRDRFYLATTIGPGLVIALFPGLWWVAPVVTAENFSDRAVFQEIFRRAVLAEGPTRWLALPPLPGSLLSEMALALLMSPTVFDLEQFEGLETRRLGTLTAEGRQLLEQHLLDLVVDGQRRHDT
jgi:hypothetical protein